jgi:hypothetical protein
MMENVNGAISSASCVNRNIAVESLEGFTPRDSLTQKGMLTLFSWLQGNLESGSIYTPPAPLQLALVAGRR